MKKARMKWCSNTTTDNMSDNSSDCSSESELFKYLTKYLFIFTDETTPEQLE